MKGAGRVGGKKRLAESELESDSEALGRSPKKARVSLA